MKKLFSLLIIITISIIGSSQISANTEKKFEGQHLSLYVSFHANMAKKLAEMFKEETGADVNFIRLPTGQAVTRIKAESGAPQASVWIGGTADAQQNVADVGLLEPYFAPNAKIISDKFKSPNGYWTGIYLETLAIGYNTDRYNKEFKAKGLPIPRTLDDLLNTGYKGEIIMPDANASGTGLTIIASILHSMGEEKGWEYIKKLYSNVAQFTTSGYTPAEKVGTGEYLIALNFVSDQYIVTDNGFPIDSTVYNNAGWNIVPIAKIKGGENSELADAFINFALSKRAGDALVKLSKAISVRPDCIAPYGGKTLEDLPIDKSYNPLQAASNKKVILEKLNKITQ